MNTKEIKMSTEYRKFLTLERLKSLHESIHFLGNYKPTKNTVDTVGETLEDVDFKNTFLLKELGDINVRREEIIKELTK